MLDHPDVNKDICVEIPKFATFLGYVSAQLHLRHVLTESANEQECLEPFDEVTESYQASWKHDGFFLDDGHESLQTLPLCYTDTKDDVERIFSEVKSEFEPQTFIADPAPASQPEAPQLRGSEVVRSAFRLTAEVDATLKRLSQDTGRDESSTSTDAKGSECKPSPSSPPLNVAKTGKGLRHFSKQVVEKLSQAGVTTYQQVADELVQEGRRQSQLDHEHGMPQPDFDEKNIRRRVYDALNVLKALGAIENEKKDIRWKGLALQQPREGQRNAERDALLETVAKKNTYLKDILDQYTGLCNLLKRNTQRDSATVDPSSIVALPFMVVRLKEDAEKVDVLITPDFREASLDFNGSNFVLHDDTSVLRHLGLCGQSRAQSTQSQEQHPAAAPRNES